MGKLDLPLNCPKPRWYAYVQCTHSGNFKAKAPEELFAFIRFLRANTSSAIIGWGMSRGGKWLSEVVRGHGGLVNVVAIFGGYPQTRCQYESLASAKELIAAICLVLMVHFDADPCCGPACFPHWHAELERHVVNFQAGSALASLNLPGSHDDGYTMWHRWQVAAHHHLKVWFETMWAHFAGAHAA